MGKIWRRLTDCLESVPIGSYREIAIAIESEAGDSLTYRSKRIFA